MTKITALTSWLSSIACGVCLVLAVLATPGTAHASNPFCVCCGTDPGSGDPTGHQAWLDCNAACEANGGCGGGPYGPFCYPNANRSGCVQGYCGVITSCKTIIMYDDYGGANCCY